MRKFYSGILLSFLCLLFNNGQSQTVLINTGSEGGFEAGTDFTANGWTVVNGTAPNKWFLGTVPTGFTNRVAYISNDAAGAAWAYANGSISIVHFYRDVTIPVGETEVKLNFKWQALGESGAFDALMVSVAPTSYVPAASTTSLGTGTLASPATTIAQLWNATGVQVVNISIPANLTGNCTAASTIRLIFTWKNDGSGGTNPPAAIDDISLISQPSRVTAGGGFFTIDNTLPNSGTNFSSFTDAISALNATIACGITGPYQFNVKVGQTFNENPPAITASGTATNTITFQKSGAGANPVITPSGTVGATDFGFGISGGDYITVDGIDITASGAAVEYGYLVRNASATDGATNNTIRNSVITLNRTNTNSIGLLQSSATTGGGVTATALSGTNASNKYHNLAIRNVYNGMLLTAGSTTIVDVDNEVGATAGGATTIGAGFSGIPAGDIANTYGVQFNNQADFRLFNTTVQNIASSGNTMRGIYIQNARGTSFVWNNRVTGLRNASATSTATISGIDASVAATGTHTLRIYNNFISDLSSAYSGAASATRQIRGIVLGGGAATSTYNVDFNSISIASQPTISSAAMELTAVTTINNIRNNIFANFTGAQTGVAKHYAIRSSSGTSIGAAGSVVNYNDLYIANTGNGFTGLANTSDLATIASWTAAITANPGTDANSIAVDPQFANNLTNLHASAPGINNQGNMNGISWVSTDIDGETRGGTPDIGADEFTPLAVDAGAITLVSPAASCDNAAATVSIRVRNAGSAVLDFSVTPLTVNASVTGPNAQTFAPVVVSTGTLAPGATLDVVITTTYNMTTGGTYTFNASTSITGDTNGTNDAMAAVTRSFGPLVTLPQIVDFTGYNGTNLATLFPEWNEAAGATPVVSESAWRNATGLGTATNVSAVINLFTNTRNEWILGPKFTAAANTKLSFDVAVTDWQSTTATDVMGADDKVQVMVSADCGATWTSVKSFSAADNLTVTLTNHLVDLSAFAGQNIIVGFYATDGPVDHTQDYDFHLDNIKIENVQPNDVGATALSTPPARGCYSATETISISVRNFGGATLDLSVNPITVSTNVTGAATATITGTLSTGTLAPGASVNVPMTGTLDMSAAGTYTFNASATVTGDANAANNSMVTATRTTLPVVALPETVNFTGFTGANLNTFFPNWLEAQGTAPAPAVSDWRSQTGLGGTGNITAVINLFTNTRNDWIIGPKFTAAANTKLSVDVAVTDWTSITVADVMGADDSVKVMVSTNCGATWSLVKAFTVADNLTTTLTTFQVDLGSFAGQNILAAIYATDGPIDNTQDYDFHVDNLKIENVQPNDVGAIALVNPLTSGCYTTAETVRITVRNFGTATLDLAASPITVTVNVTGAVTTTLTGTLNTGPLAPNSTATVDLSAPLNMTTAGTYTFNATASVNGDVNATNNSMVAVTRVVQPVVTVPQSVNFTGFTGANLNTIFPNWREGAGVTTPAGAASTWRNISGLGGSGNVTAAINIFSAAQNEWIIGPKILAAASTALKLDVAVTDWNAVNAPDVMGSDDKVSVMVSTDCGVTWTSVKDFSATDNLSNSLSSRTIPLMAYAGQNIIVALRGTSGTTDDTPDYDFHIDNLNLYEIPAVDVGPVAIVMPPVNCPTPLVTIQGTIRNHSLLPLDLSVHPVTLTANVSGAGTETLTGTLNSGILAPNASVNIILTPTMNLVNGGTYSVTLTSGTASDGDVTNDTYATSFFINTPPQVPVITQAAGGICTGNTQQLIASGSSYPVTGTIGTGTGTSTVTTPYKGFWGGQKVQYLYTAAELQAMGLRAGMPINTIGFNISTFTSPYTFNGFTIKMKHTTATVMTTTMETGLNIVFGPVNYTLTGSASFTTSHTLTAPFVWDGTSNLLVETCFNNNNGGGAAGNSAAVVSTTTLTNMTRYFSADNSTTVCDATTGATTSTARANITLGYTAAASYNWTPVAGLFTNAAGTIAYTGGAADTVYAAPSVTSTYSVTALSGTTCTSTSSAVVTVIEGTVITVPPVASVAVCPGASTTLSVTATGAGLTYQWKRNGIVIPGAVSSTFPITNMTIAEAGSYTVIVRGTCGTDSAVANVSFVLQPQITTHPVSQAVCTGNTITLSVAAQGFSITYQWRKNSQLIAGATSSNYTISNFSTADAGSYDVVVNSLCGFSITSNAAVLSFAAVNSWVGNSNTDWNNPLNWCSGVPLNTSDVSIPSGTQFHPVINGNSNARNVTVNSGATLTITSSGNLNLFGHLVNNGTFNSTAGMITFSGTANQDVASVTAASIVMNGTGGITLNGNMNIGTALTLTNGNITLGSNNLVMTGGSTGSVASHIITNGTGRVTNNNITVASVVFPVGPNAGSYNPVMVANGQGRNYTAGVTVGVPSTVANSARAINRTWVITSSAAVTTPVTLNFQYADADVVSASAIPTANMEVGVNNGTGWLITSPSGGVIPTGTAAERRVVVQTTTFGPMVVANIGGVNFPTAVPNVDPDVTGIILMPNLVETNTVLRINTRRTMKINWSIADANGRIVMTFGRQVLAGQNDLPLNLGHLAVGVYYVTGYTEKGKTITLRFVRQ
jgi:hypothetical protein